MNSSSFLSSLVSSYTAKYLALCRGPDFIVAFARMISSNPALDGHLFVAWLLASLMFHHLKYELRGPPRSHSQWERRVARLFDSTQPFDVMALPYCVPLKWNQAGYDAVYTELFEIPGDDPGAEATRRAVNHVFKYRVVFLQITRAKQHSYDPQPFVELLLLLGKSKELVGSVELWYVVPRSLLASFAVPVTDRDFGRGVMEVAFVTTFRQVAHRVRVACVDYPLDTNGSIPGATMFDVQAPCEQSSFNG